MSALYKRLPLSQEESLGQTLLLPLFRTPWSNMLIIVLFIRVSNTRSAKLKLVWIVSNNPNKDSGHEELCPIAEGNSHLHAYY